MHHAHFAEDAPDVDWIAEVGARGWVVLTRDKGIRRKDNERRAVKTAALRVFTLSGGNMTGEQMATVLVAQRARIERLARKQKAPLIATVSASEVRVLMDFAEDKGAENEEA